MPDQKHLVANEQSVRVSIVTGFHTAQIFILERAIVSLDLNNENLKQ